MITIYDYLRVMRSNCKFSPLYCDMYLIAKTMLLRGEMQ